MKTTLELRAFADQARAPIESGPKPPSGPTGPKTPEGKAVSSQNAVTFGFNSTYFFLLRWEVKEDYDELLKTMREEFHPATPHHEMLVAKMTQHYWLTQRAFNLQKCCFDYESPVKGACGWEPQLALYLRYQTTHERAFLRYRKELLEISRNREKDQREFVSQKRRNSAAEVRQTEDARKAQRQAAEAAQREELQRARIRLANARAEHQELKNRNLPQPVTQIADTKGPTQPEFVSQNADTAPQTEVEQQLQHAA